MPELDFALQVRKLVASADLPKRGSTEAAGYDLSACLKDSNGTPRSTSIGDAGMLLKPGARALVPTGLAFTVPLGTYGRIAPRSGLALRHGIDTLAGVIDRDYTDEVGIVLVNLGENAFVVEHGMRIAQLVLEKILHPDIHEVDELTMAGRMGGFGSTGV